jgi:hypothetical protein
MEDVGVKGFAHAWETEVISLLSILHKIILPRTKWGKMQRLLQKIKKLSVCKNHHKLCLHDIQVLIFDISTDIGLVI